MIIIYTAAINYFDSVVPLRAVAQQRRRSKMKYLTVRRRVEIRGVYRERRQKARLVIDMPKELGVLVKSRVRRILGISVANGRRSR